MRSSNLAVWLSIAASALACDGGGHDDISALDTGFGTDSHDAQQQQQQQQLRDRICASSPLMFASLQSTITKNDTSQYGVLDTADEPLVDEGVVPDGLGDSEEARIRYGTSRSFVHLTSPHTLPHLTSPYLISSTIHHIASHLNAQHRLTHLTSSHTHSSFTYTPSQISNQHPASGKSAPPQEKASASSPSLPSPLAP